MEIGKSDWDNKNPYNFEIFANFLNGYSLICFKQSPKVY